LEKGGKVESKGREKALKKLKGGRGVTSRKKNKQQEQRGRPAKTKSSPPTQGGKGIAPEEGRGKKQWSRTQNRQKEKVYQGKKNFDSWGVS